VREDDGLAMSSRNQYLSKEERAIAPRLYELLGEICSDLESGKRNFKELEKNAVAKLETLGFDPDYVSIRRAENLAAPNRDTDELVVRAAARLGETRLIDNLPVHV
jgi:pantoate--beta-alanine ligase